MPLLAAGEKVRNLVKAQSGHEQVEAVDQPDSKTHDSFFPMRLQPWVGNRDAIHDRTNKKRDQKADVVMIMEAKRIGGLPNACNQARSKRKGH